MFSETTQAQSTLMHANYNPDQECDSQFLTFLVFLSTLDLTRGHCLLDYGEGVL